MNKNALLIGLLFAFLGLLLLVFKANDIPHRTFLIVLFCGGYLPAKFMERRKKWISNRSFNLALLLTIIGLFLFIANNDYTYSVLGFTLLSDIIFKIIFKKK